MSQFDKIKREKFGEIKDFSDPQDKLRNTAGYKLSLGDWFWFNPFAFRFIMIGMPVSFMLNGLIMIFIHVVYDKLFLLIVGILLIVASGVDLYKKADKVKPWKVSKHNFYDQFLREYK